MRLLVCGSRSFANRGLVEEVLTGIYTVHGRGWHIDHTQPFFICHGAAPGADTLADLWANSEAPGPFVWGEDVKAPSDLVTFRDCPIVLHRFPADWEGPCDPSFCKPGHRRNRGMNGGQSYCPAAGPRRNRRMLDEFEPTRLVAFIDRPLDESRGTRDMVEIAEARGIEVAVIESHARN